jgi:hypothetical protein
MITISCCSCGWRFLLASWSLAVPGMVVLINARIEDLFCF